MSESPNLSRFFFICLPFRLLYFIIFIFSLYFKFVGAKIHLLFLFKNFLFQFCCKSYAIVFVHFRLFISFCQMRIKSYFCRRKQTNFKPNYNNKSQNFRKWFKNGLKVQKLLAHGVWGNTCYLYSTSLSPFIS